MKVSSDFRSIARDKLGNKWTKAPWSTFAIAALIVILITGAISGLANVFGYDQITDLGDGITVVTRYSNPFIDMAGTLLVTEILNFSLMFMGLKIVDGKGIEVGDTFYGYKKFGRAFLCQLLVSIFVFLWALLFIIPGIIHAFAYAMTPYIVMEDDNISITDAMKKSKEMMKGNKWRLFCLIFSFIGWILLGIITFGIVLVWIEPYMQVAMAAFYRELVPAKETEQSFEEDFEQAPNEQY